LTNYFLVKPIQHLLELKNLYLCLAIGWTLLIAILCLVSFNNLPTIGIGGADKYVHFIFHFVFTLLWFMYVKTRYPNPSLSKIGLTSLGYGISLEIAQGLFTTTRSADIFDVMANATGAGIAIVVILLARKLLNNRI